MMRPPLRTNFMLLVPEALWCAYVSHPVRRAFIHKTIYTYSVPAVEMCSLMSDAGVMISALLTL